MLEPQPISMCFGVSVCVCVCVGGVGVVGVCGYGCRPMGYGTPVSDTHTPTHPHTLRSCEYFIELTYEYHLSVCWLLSSVDSKIEENHNFSLACL